MRVLPGPERAEPDRADDWMRLAAPQGDQVTVAHVTGSTEDAPRVAAVVEALAQTGAFRQIVLSPPTDELAELGVSSAVRLPEGPMLLEGLHARLDGARPAVVMVHGYDEVALVGALAAARQQVSLVRVGRAPEAHELARLVDRLADLVLVHDQQDACQVERMRVPAERIRVVGNPLIDAVRWSLRDPGGRAWRGAEQLERGGYLLGILTRGVLAGGVDEQLAALAATSPLVLIGDGSEQRFAGARAAGATLLPQPGFNARLAMIRNAGAILTDSERAMEEAAAVGVRCHTLGLPPSRIRAATTVDLGDDIAAIATLRPLGGDPTPCAVPLWDGRAGTRIADIMLANFARVRMLA
jgi:UDP-N-acetylglucosamine 2-epimerase (non-hydrolysing)